MEKKKKISTKQKILNEAIRLYNEFGAHNITSRHIAAELGISHGNLDYHYNNREAILLAIYKQMREEMTTSIKEYTNIKSSFEAFHCFLVHLDKFQMKYRFFNLDVLEISRGNPEVGSLLKKTILQRRDEMTNLFERFIAEGFIEPKIGTGFHRLRHTIRIVITFWLSQRELLSGFNFQEPGEMVIHIWELLIPYMTDLGDSEYKRLISEYGYFIDEDSILS